MVRLKKQQILKLSGNLRITHSPPMQAPWPPDLPPPLARQHRPRPLRLLALHRRHRQGRADQREVRVHPKQVAGGREGRRTGEQLGFWFVDYIAYFSKVAKELATRTHAHRKMICILFVYLFDHIRVVHNFGAHAI